MGLRVYLMVVVFCLSSAFSFETEAAGAASARWTLNDLSILYPLPAKLEDSALILASTSGAKGALVPWGNYQSLPVLAPFFRTKESEYKSLRLVGLRIDPCFPSSPGVCQRQMRAVWQPLIENRMIDPPFLTVDAGVHTFYNLSEDEYSRFMGELRALRDAQGISTEGPLWVHPILSAQGLDGAFGAGLKDLILKFAGERNLSRMTFMLMRGGSILWAFGGVNYTNGVATTINIPRLGGTEARPAKLQTFVNRSLKNEDFQESDLKPAPKGVDTFSLLMRDSRVIRPVEDRSDLDENLASIYRLEHPDHHNSETSDCVSCHVAQPARDFALNRFGASTFPASIHALSYRSEYDLTNKSSRVSFTANLHSFGYFQQRPSLSQRMINEAAAVATLVNTEGGTAQK